MGRSDGRDGVGGALSPPFCTMSLAGDQQAAPGLSCLVSSCLMSRSSGVSSPGAAGIL